MTTNSPTPPPCAWTDPAQQLALFEQAPGFICVMHGPQHVFAFVNAAFRRLFGRVDVIGKPVREVFPDLEGQTFFGLMDRAYASGEQHVARNVEVRLQHPGDGAPSLMRLHFVYAPVHDNDGKVAGIFCEGYDVTEAFAAQASLIEREEQLRLATEAAEVGLWDVDLISHTMYWPPRVKAMFGISTEVPVSLADYYDGLHPDDFQATAAAFAAAVDPQRRITYDVEYRTIGKEDGIVRWVAAKGRGLFDDAGRCVRVIGTAIDISARKAAEAALLRSEEGLRESSRRKDQFLATLAHELRNPLAPLHNAIALLQPTPQQTQLRDIMRRQVDHLMRLVDDLLEVSRIDGDHFALQLAPVDIATVIHHAVETSEPLMQERGHALTVDLPAAAVWVHADAVRLAQIVSNLLNNAARYTPPGGRIAVQVHARGAECEIAVVDNGIGFDADHHRRMFDMFQRGAASSGLGIGLALSRKLAEMHEGRLEAASAGVGQGARFGLHLRCMPPPLPVHDAPTRAADAAPLARLRVLVVDDNVDAADTMAMLLQGADADVQVAYDGEQALRILQAFAPHAVFLDIGMPGMDGFELARRIRSGQFCRTATLIGLSGWGQAEDVARGRDAGFDHHLVKPVGFETVLALLQRLRAA